MPRALSCGRGSGGFEQRPRGFPRDGPLQSACMIPEGPSGAIAATRGAPAWVWLAAVAASPPPPWALVAGDECGCSVAGQRFGAEWWGIQECKEECKKETGEEVPRSKHNNRNKGPVPLPLQARSQQRLPTDRWQGAGWVHARVGAGDKPAAQPAAARCLNSQARGAPLPRPGPWAGGAAGRRPDAAPGACAACAAAVATQRMRPQPSAGHRRSKPRPQAGWAGSRLAPQHQPGSLGLH